MNTQTLILASQSPRRRELLSQLGLPFDVIVPNTDETQHRGEPPEAYAIRLSREKAQTVAQMANTPALVIAADTIVVDENEILGKPLDVGQAASMLRRLRSRIHTVITAVTVLDTALDRAIIEAPATLVTMRDYSDQEIAEYIATGDPMDKAGAYAIQHPVFRPVESLEGCYATVMGLPVCRVARLLEQFGVTLSHEAVEACHNHMGYPCGLYDSR